jgi:16S rRNA G527 N7-methylase RsmG
MPADFRVEKIVPLNVPGLDAERHLVIVRRRDRHA